MIQDEYKKEVSKLIIGMVDNIDYDNIVNATLHSMLYLKDINQIGGHEKKAIIIDSISDILEIQDCIEYGSTRNGLSKLIEKDGLIDTLIESYIFVSDQKFKFEPKTKSDKLYEFLFPRPYLNIQLVYLTFVSIVMIFVLIMGI